VFAIASGHNLALIVASFCVVSIGAHSYLPSFWAMPTAFLTESAAAAAIGLINSVGNLGGFVGPFALGYLKDKTGAHSAGWPSWRLRCSARGYWSWRLSPARNKQMGGHEMGKVVRYEFIGKRTVLWAQLLLLLIMAIFFPWISVAVIPNLIVYLLFTVVKIEEEIEHPNEFIANFKEEMSRK